MVVVRLQPRGELSDEFQGSSGIAILDGHHEGVEVGEPVGHLEKLHHAIAWGDEGALARLEAEMSRREDHGDGGEGDPQGKRGQGMRYLQGKKPLQPLPNAVVPARPHQLLTPTAYSSWASDIV